ncbi:hypothetical protein BRC64_03390 [Halobacteriales archaeon QH_10_67_22]|nr:MAG: hypothetical protein BRC64_03390 [Halobacteriales archaeon QH_10_67_22]
MSRSGAFCPRCGDPVDPEDHGDRPGDDVDPDSPLCDACYFERFDLVDAPDRVEVRVCSECGAVHRGNRWVDVGAEDYTDVAVEEVAEALGVHVDATDVSWEVAPEQVDGTTIRMHCEFTGVVRGTLLTESVVVPVKIGRETCTRCGRIAGGSYASRVQIRATDRTPTEDERARAREIAESYVADREAAGDRDAFVSEITDRDEGLDVKLSTNKLGQGVAKRVVEQLGGTFTDNETLVTEDGDGNEVYRVTYAVRLPKFRPGEVIDPGDDEGPVLVRSVQGNLKGTRLTTGDDYEASFEDGIAPDARRLGTVDDATETTLVAVEDDHAVQVLDPDTYEAMRVPHPDYLDPDADAVPVVKSRAGLHVVPESGDEDDRPNGA